MPHTRNKGLLTYSPACGMLIVIFLTVVIAQFIPTSWVELTAIAEEQK